MRYVHPDDDTHLATVGEADAEYAHNVGREHPERAWILSDRDVWYPNPAYRGPAVPHPEDDRGDDDCDDGQGREPEWTSLDGGTHPDYDGECPF